jgi:predicted HicB family RNase H-like nuclease
MKEKQTTLHIRNKLHRRLKKRAIDRGVTVSQLANRLLTAALSREVSK